jgi:hypothetical protein
MFEATKHNMEGKGSHPCPPCWQERAQLLPFHRLRSPVALLSVAQERFAQMMAVCRMMRRWMTVFPKMCSLVSCLYGDLRRPMLLSAYVMEFYAVLCPSTLVRSALLLSCAHAMPLFAHDGEQERV